ncbi:flagellar biosynthesis repressor FlbT [Alsobacter sp. SYSU BS001988]
MGFLLELKHQEVAYVGKAVLTNTGDRARIMVEGPMPVLRGQDYVDPGAAKTPAEKIYVAVQEMYLSGSDDAAPDFFAASRRLIAQRPHAEEPISQLSKLVLAQDMAKALKVARTLIQLEVKAA